MSSFNPYDPPRAKSDDAPEEDPPPAATEIIRAIPIAILGSILLSYAVAFAVAKWTRPPPEARLMPLLFFAIPPLVVAASMSLWAIVRNRRRQAWLAAQRDKRMRSKTT